MSMHARKLALVGSLVAALLAAALAVVTSAAADPQRPGTANYGSFHPAGCNVATPTKGDTSYARCYAEGLMTKDGKLAQQQDGPLPTSLGPAQIQGAYNCRPPGHRPDRGGRRRGRLRQRRVRSGGLSRHYGLPRVHHANGCFTKVDQNGGTNYPAEDPDWSIETALDLDAVSSACPACHILLVEGDSQPRRPGHGGRHGGRSRRRSRSPTPTGWPARTATESYYDHYYDHTGIAVTASTGDTGNVTNWPATSPNVIAVGGTTLTADTSARGWAESPGPRRVSGCSLYEPRPDYQTGVDTNCPDNPAIADVAADADPSRPASPSTTRPAGRLGAVRRHLTLVPARRGDVRPGRSTGARHATR